MVSGYVRVRPYFQFSFWDSLFQTEATANILHPVFQFSFWDSNLRWCPPYPKNVFTSNFQFSFWDSWLPTEDFLRMVLNSFNSLFEIQRIELLNMMMKYIRNFQFSFWDSWAWCRGMRRSSPSLSILFLRFAPLESRPLLLQAWAFQFSFWDSLTFTEIQELMNLSSFQFSFWDSSPSPQPPSRRQKITFNSLFEIRLGGACEGPREASKTFNSLFEILRLSESNFIFSPYIYIFQFSFWDSIKGVGRAR